MSRVEFIQSLPKTGITRWRFYTVQRLNISRNRFIFSSILIKLKQGGVLQTK